MNWFRKPQNKAPPPERLAEGDAPTRITPLDSEVLEEWSRETDEPEARGLSVTRQEGDDWNYAVTVSAMEFVRVEPLETILRDDIRRALSAVPGVRRVEEEDREVWIVDGKPTCEALALTAASVIDRHLVAIRRCLDELGDDSGEEG